MVDAAAACSGGLRSTDNIVSVVVRLKGAVNFPEGFFSTSND